ncbi:hypothetical protein PLICRDRAFT_83876, partial [Plicaturopsis crispa FD-325 SS-3]
PGCMAGTRTTLLSEIDKWPTTGGKAKIYWLNGIAGTGKTAVATSVAYRFKAQKMLGATFFCSHSDAERRDAQHILPTIAYGLALSLPAFSTALVQILKAEPDVGHHALSDSLFQKLIVKPFLQMQMPHSPTIVVIDALDECTDHTVIHELLTLLCKYMSQLSALYFFVTGRPEIDI